MAVEDDIVACETCGLVQRVAPLARGTAAECVRCESFLHPAPEPGRLHLTAAFSLAALVLYIPANVYPILRMSAYGAYSENTVFSGSIELMRQGEWLVGAVVFAASIVVPLVKIAALLFLVVAARLRLGRRLREQTRLFKLIDLIGPWAMLDVFLLAILVALVQLNDLAMVWPGPGLAAFTGVVVLTMLASSSFDPRLLWMRDGR